VISAPVCRLAPECRQAVAKFERSQADCIIALHLAYSPSLACADALAKSPLPLIFLDITMDYDFGHNVSPARIAYNHGIHGAMDLAAVLRRRQKPFAIVAGHATRSPAIARAAALARAAFAARSLRGTKALRVGRSFKGMGDFAVAASALKRGLGIAVKEITAKALAPYAARLSEHEIEEEMAADRRAFAIRASAEAHRRATQTGLALRRYLDQGGFDALSMNFLAFQSAGPLLASVPFVECSKAMARGIGYAGEGDVLTAALVGALQRAFGRTTFAEIFCPDWKGNSLFLSHMGEINPAVAASQPALVEKDLPYTRTLPSVVMAGAPAEGPAVLVDLAPCADNAFELILAPVTVLADTRRRDIRQNVRGWIRPQLPIADFLEAYSHAGGTHHSALVLGGSLEALAAFGRMAGMRCKIII
ncbi:MAG: hypothetical protein N3A66_03795, partial [Planctomycetota bacterium]|nr:hypothetical protein [Planctomycetota bacterium]